MSVGSGKPSHTRASFNYLEGGTMPSLYRNGRLRLQRDPDGNDSQMVGVNLDGIDNTVCNGRDGRSPTLARNGFELLARPLAGEPLNFFDHQQVVDRYYPHCASLVAEHCGAEAVFAFDHNVRSAPDKQQQARIAGGQQVQQPIQMVHGDYTLTSAPERMQQLARAPGRNDTWRSMLASGETLISQELLMRAKRKDGRFAFINVWRNIANTPVRKHPLALCDAQTVSPEDLAVFELHYQDRIGENYFARHAERHAWFYFPEMLRDEALLIKQWDSAGALARSKGELADNADPEAPCTFSFHSAFEDPASQPDAPERQSIEVRCVVIY